MASLSHVSGWFPLVQEAFPRTLLLSLEALQSRPVKGWAQRQARLLRLLYGSLGRTTLDRALAASRGQAGGLWRLLECRADVVMARSHLRPSIAAARQALRHGHLQVNGAVMTMPARILRPGDVLRGTPVSTVPEPHSPTPHAQSAGGQGPQAQSAGGQGPQAQSAGGLRPHLSSAQCAVLGQWLCKAMFRRRFVKRYDNPFGGRAPYYYVTLHHRGGSAGVPSQVASLTSTLLQGIHPQVPRVRPTQALQVEVSPRLGAAILLYSPQGVCLPCPVDVEALF